METEKLLKCPPGYKIQCTEDHDQDEYCCCCVRVEKSTEKPSASRRTWSASLPEFARDKFD